MRRIQLHRPTLFGYVFTLSCCTIIFLTLWSVLDPPRRQTAFTLTDRMTADGETLVYIKPYCDSASRTWQYLAAGCQTFLLLVATVLAFVTRGVRTSFNESQTLGLMVECTDQATALLGGNPNLSPHTAGMEGMTWTSTEDFEPTHSIQHGGSPTKSPVSFSKKVGNRENMHALR